MSQHTRAGTGPTGSSTHLGRTEPPDETPQRPTSTTPQFGAESETLWCSDFRRRTERERFAMSHFKFNSAATIGFGAPLEEAPVAALPLDPLTQQMRHVRTAIPTRSSAQGNCSAKSLVASVMYSILPCLSILPYPPCLPPVMLSAGEVQL